MDGLLLLMAEVMVLGVAAWVIVMDTKSPEEVSRVLDPPAPAPRPPRFATVTATSRPARQPGRPRGR
jgi:hypothetical protein